MAKATRIEMTHPKMGGIARVLKKHVATWQAAGWVAQEDQAEPLATPVEGALSAETLPTEKGQNYD